ncbi:MFS transporter [Paenibacillus gorillae]|uniref:MFS transporter n=1 Tax=Paenibacillus gorillae TaxID=1243662 RepID=UPI0004B27BFD|nr:MFS transporter [Paenibacillus gorillae]
MQNKRSYRWWVLIALAIGLLAVGLDLTILNLALPTLAADLHSTSSELQWYADAYTLVFAAALLPAGLFGDRWGRKKLLLAGLLLFGAASLICAYAPSSEMLIAGRALLGFGAALIVPMSMAIIPVLFEEEERSKAIGVWVLSNAIGIPLGPIAGGWLLNHFAWGSIFLINIPLIAIALIAVSIMLEESRNKSESPIDYAGILLSSLGLISLTYGVIKAGENGWGDLLALTTIFTGVVLLAGFIYWERRIAYPLVSSALFRSRGFTWGTIMATLISFAMFGLLFVLPQYFQIVEGTDALGAGLRLLPLIGGLLIGSQITEKLLRHLGASSIFAIGFALLAAGLAIGAFSAVGDSYSWTVIWVVAAGLGIGFVLPTAMDISMAALTAEQSGVGSALIMALRNVGGTLGVALLGTVLGTAYRGKLELSGVPDGMMDTVSRSASAGAAAAVQQHSTELLHTVQAAFVYGMNHLLWICTIVAMIGIVLAIVFMRLKQQHTRSDKGIEI